MGAFLVLFFFLGLFLFGLFLLFLGFFLGFLFILLYFFFGLLNRILLGFGGFFFLFKETSQQEIALGRFQVFVQGSSGRVNRFHGRFGLCYGALQVFGNLLIIQ